MSLSRTLFPGLALGLALVAAACGSSAAPTSVASAMPSAGGSAAAAPPAPATTAAASTAIATGAAASGAVTADPTAACTAPATPTTAQTEGPYYKAGAPQSADLTTDAVAGTRVTLTGVVVDTSCTPLANAKVEIWQADASGTYDNTGYTLRGWVLTDAQGRYTIRTVVPGEYPGRTEHIHVKVTPDGGSTLTTQVYFPGTAANDGDGIYSPDMLLGISQDGDALVGTYTFVVAG